MIIIFIRTLIIFIALIVVMRLMGKRQIGEMQPFEFVITLIIADLACAPMADVSIPLSYGIVAILAMFLMHQLMSIMEKSGNLMKRVISGKPSVVINKDGVDLLELKKNDLDVEDLIESMRSAGYFALDDLDYAIFESNGKLSALEKKDYLDRQPALPILVVNDGKLNHAAIKNVKMEESAVFDFLKQSGARIKEVEIMTLDNNGRVYLQKRGKKYEILDFPLPEGLTW